MPGFPAPGNGENHGKTAAKSSILVAIYPLTWEKSHYHYINRAIIGLIQEVLAKSGSVVVDPSVYRENGLVPVEIDGCLEFGEHYYTVGENEIVKGMCVIWKYDVDGVPFYEDNVMFDVFVDSDTAQSVIKNVSEECAIRGVTFKDFGEGTSGSGNSPGGIKPWLKRMWGRKSES
jgi:hypothetical protein